MLLMPTLLILKGMVNSMKPKNMETLVGTLSKYMQTGEHHYSPKNEQYDYYADIFIGEMKGKDPLWMDNFSEILAKALTKKGLHPTNDIGEKPTAPQERYKEFCDTWHSWCLIVNRLNKKWYTSGELVCT